MNNYKITQTQCGHIVAFGTESVMRKAYTFYERRGPGYELSEYQTALSIADATPSCEHCE